MSYVSNGPLREAFIASGLTAGELAVRLGYVRERNPVRRTLGLASRSPSTKGPKLQTRIQEVTAVRYARALHLAPWEIGL